MFLSQNEHALTEEYLSQGFIVRQAADIQSLENIRLSLCKIVREILDVSDHVEPEVLLNSIHDRVKPVDLNNFRLKVIQGMNALSHLRLDYFKVAKPYLETLVGNELAMQLRVNLSIQLPQDSSSLLPLHADTWSGDSPYEIVVWLPLVDCYKTKSMYILQPDQSRNFTRNFSQISASDSEELYRSISSEVRFIDIKYGEVMLFDQGLPHGNRINEERGTRWSMNCRFKGIFTPYGDKKIGEFFEPITLRATSKVGMNYRFPRTSDERD